MFEKKMFKICLNFSLFSPFTLKLYIIQLSLVMLIKLCPQSGKVMCLLIKTLLSRHLFLQNQQFEYQINVRKLLTIKTPERRRWRHSLLCYFHCWFWTSKCRLSYNARFLTKTDIKFIKLQSCFHCHLIQISMHISIWLPK